MARKQVERLRPSARLQAVARPVETYVRPAEQPAPKSGLGEFIRAIAPAAETLAQVEKQKQLKLQREAEQGIASERTFSAKLSVGAALRQAREDYRNNEPDYLEMSEEEITARRAEIMQPFLQQAQDSGDDLLFQAVKGNIEMGNLAWFETTYDPAKFKHTFNKNMGTVGDEVIGISEDIGYGTKDFEDEDGDPALAANRQFSLDLQKKNIDEIVKQAAQAYGYSQSMVNDYVMENIIAPRVRTNGRDAAYQWATSVIGNKGDLTKVSRYQKLVKAMNRDLASYDSERFKAGKTAYFKSKVQSQVTQFLETKQVNSIGGDVVFEDGTSQSVTEKDIVAAIEAEAVRQNLSEGDALRMLYVPLQRVPAKDKNAILSGLAAFSAGIGLTDENVALSAAAYTSYKKMDGFDIDMSKDILTEDQRKLMRALDYHIEKAGVGPEGPAMGTVKEALELVRTIDLSLPTRKASTTEIQDALDRGITDISDFDELKNTRSMLPYIQEGVDVYMQMGVDLDKATIQAVKDARKDFVIVESSIGSKHALPLLNTNVNRNGNEVAKLQSYIDEEAQRPSTIKAIEAEGGAGLVLTRSLNPSKFTVAIINEDGIPVGSLGELPVSVALNPETAQAMIAERIQRTSEDSKYVSGVMGTIDDAQFVGSPTITNYFGGTGKVGEAGTFEDFIKSPVVKDLRKAFSVDNVVLQKIWSMRPTAEGIGREVDFLKEQLDKLKGTGKLRETVTPEAAAAKRAEQGTGVGKINLMNAFTDMFSDAGPQASEVINKIASTLNPVSTAAATTIMKDEGFKYTPYDDMGKQSVGHGLQIESLEPDEKALIKDVNNVQPEESTAVVALKVQKTSDYFTDVVDGFKNLPESAQSGMIQMGYQLGRFNVTKEWPKFMESIKEAAKYAEGSVEQATALAKAKFNMLYNVAEDGKVTATKWATQTKDRAMRVADEVGATLGEAATSVFDGFISKAHADTDAIPEAEKLNVGDVPTASAVVDIALSQNPADAAYKYYGIDENTEEGAKAVKGFFETSVGNWNPDQETAEQFATNKAWCAAFLTQVLRDSGVDTKALFGTDKFDQIRAKAYTKVGTEVEPTQVKAGDIMIKQHTKEERKKFKLGYGHVGIVVKVEGDEVFFIGGNTGDRVTMSSYNMTEKEVNFRRVQNASDIPTESLPSMLELKAGVYARKTVKKAKNFLTSMYDNIFG